MSLNPDTATGTDRAAPPGPALTPAPRPDASIPGRRPSALDRSRSALLGLGRRLLHITPLVGFLLVWELASPESTSGLPPPSAWWSAFETLLADGVLGEAIATTARTFVIGFGLACVVGLVLGSVIGSSRRLEEATTWVVDFGRALPVVVVIPPAVLVFKYGTALELFTVCFGASWPIVLAVVRGASDLNPTLLAVGRVFGLGRFVRLRKLLIPAVMPAYLSGIRIAAPMALIGTIAVEILTGSGGIGAELALAATAFDSSTVWALVVVAGIVGWCVNLLADLAFRIALRSRGSTAEAL